MSYEHKTSVQTRQAKGQHNQDLVAFEPENDLDPMLMKDHPLLGSVSDPLSDLYWRESSNDRRKDLLEATRRSWGRGSQDSDDWTAERPPWRWSDLLATAVPQHADDAPKDRLLEVPPLTNDCASRQQSCETVETIHTKEVPGIPFIKGRAYGKGDPTAASHDDVKQGNNNSCYLLAALMSMTRQAPGHIEERIDYDENGKMFKVWLYLPDQSGALSLQAVEVDGGFHVDEKGKPIYARGGDSNREGEELWVMLFEKAYAKIKGGYQGIEWGGQDRNEEVLEMLTGNEAEHFKIKGHSPEEVRATLEQYLAEKRVMTTVTKSVKNDPAIETTPITVLFPGGQSKADTLKSRGEHRFTIIAVDDSGVTLEFPAKGGNNICKISLEDYVQHFRDIKSASTVPLKSQEGTKGSKAHSKL